MTGWHILEGVIVVLAIVFFLIWFGGANPPGRGRFQ